MLFPINFAQFISQLMHSISLGALFCFLYHCSLQKRYANRPIIEFEIAAQEQMKVTELRLAKLFSAKPIAASTDTAVGAKKAEGTSPFIKHHDCYKRKFYETQMMKLIEVQISDIGTILIWLNLFLSLYN